MEHLDTFLARWQKAGGTERANYQLFLTELCGLLGLPLPEPAGDDTRDNAYVFERRVVINQPDGSSNNGFIDLYKRGSFVLEAKQTGKTLDSSGWDKAMLKAHNQADQYARALPAEEGRPPFILVVDVGRNIELYAEFSRSGATYTPYPDSRSHRIRLEDLRKEEVRERLSAVWLDPLSLDPARRSAKVTREIADQLAKLAKSLEATGNSPQLVSSFLMRALFTMFAEDVGLLPERSFTELLQRLKNKPDTFAPMLEHLWQTMNSGGFSPILESTLLKFNGGLFAEASAIALDRDQMELLLKASEADWRYVEPAIFGTLLERALNPRERHKLGAHYTPRAYVERLVLPTVIEPLRAEWKEVQVAALTYEGQGKHKEAIAEIRAFHRHLCDVRVLDPACGSGNFLYVTLEHMKRLEGEVLNLLHDLGESQGLLELQGVTVDPHQFLGLEINPRAARIAEMVLWIGYLQWHFRTHGKVNPPEPVLRDFHNIEHRDALIAYDSVDLVTDESGKPLTRWDGITTKTSPITGEQVPDESAQTPIYQYSNPRKSQWPKADFIIGNPPYIGLRKLKATFSEEYVTTLRAIYPEVPETCDYVMYWWEKSACELQNGTNRFGLITTNSIVQEYSRKLLNRHIGENGKVIICFAIAEHPWVDEADGAAVGVSMTVGCSYKNSPPTSYLGSPGKSESDPVTYREVTRIGTSLDEVSIHEKIQPLRSNAQICFQGVVPAGDGFKLDELELKKIGWSLDSSNALKKYIIGKDLVQKTETRYIIDLFGHSEIEAKNKYPDLYQRLLDRVYPERKHNKRDTYREKWWIFAEPRPAMRKALSGLKRFIATPYTAKYRPFIFVDIQTLPDAMVYAIASDDAAILGFLSSKPHVIWSNFTGGTLENRPRYNSKATFFPFPFPNTTPDQQAQIRDLAERLDAHRKRQQAQHPELTLTGMYNVLEKLRSEEPLTAKEKTIHAQGLVSLLRELHDELDRAVFAAYGWDELAAQLVGKPGATTPLPDAQAEAEEELLRRLVALNAERAAEEARGLVRWLRPEYQNPSAAVAPEQSEAELDDTTDFESAPAAAAATGKLTWPKQMREQVAAVRQALAQGPLPAEAIAAQFKRSPKIAVQAVLGALEELGMVQQDADQYRLAS